MAAALFDSLRNALAGKVLKDEPLSRHTTWRVGGAADLFVVPADRRDLLTAWGLIARAACPNLILGAGSNLLAGDGGFRGVVVHTGRLRRSVFGPAGEVTAEAGLPLMALVRESARRGLGGLEDLAGIPGTVGGAVVMNAGAGSREMADVLETVTLTDPRQEQVWPAERLGFAYRHSDLPTGMAVVEAQLQLRPTPTAQLEERIRTRLQDRRKAQQVGYPNAGSVFKNPPGQKAWRLIEAAGMRGAAVGDARVAERHANFIVNRGRATAAEILELIERIRERVRARTGIDLEPEIRVVGER